MSFKKILFLIFVLFIFTAVFPKNIPVRIERQVFHYPDTLKTLKFITTAYTSSIYECDDTPFITASNTITRLGVIAASQSLVYGKNPLLPFGTNVMIEGYNNLFIVEDVMHHRFNGKKYIDIWMENRESAFAHGKRILNVNIVNLKEIFYYVIF